MLIVLILLIIVALILFVVIFSSQDKTGGVFALIVDFIMAVIAVISFQTHKPEIYISEYDNNLIKITSSFGTKIYYTTDGTDPQYGILYKEPLQVDEVSVLNSKAKLLIWWSESATFSPISPKSESEGGEPTPTPDRATSPSPAPTKSIETTPETKTSPNVNVLTKEPEAIGVPTIQPEPTNTSRKNEPPNNTDIIASILVKDLDGMLLCNQEICLIDDETRNGKSFYTDENGFLNLTEYDFYSIPIAPEIKYTVYKCIGEVIIEIGYVYIDGLNSIMYSIN